MWWMKLALCLILSNILFFNLFSAAEGPNETREELSEGQVQIQIRGELFTPFSARSRVLLTRKQSGQIVTGVILAHHVEEQKFTILVDEKEAPSLLQHDHWDILPYIKDLSFQRPPKGAQHEIRY